MFFNNYKKHDYKEEDKLRIENFHKECQEAVENIMADNLCLKGKIGSLTIIRNMTIKKRTH